MREKIIFRIVLILPSLFIVSLLVFVFMYHMPGDAGRMILFEKNRTVNIKLEEVEVFEKEQNIDKGFLPIFSTWIQNLMQGNLGKSFVDGENINAKIIKSFSKTLTMAVIALITYSFVGTIIGVLSAINNNKLMNKVIKYWAILSTSIPAFWIALFMVWIFSVKFKLISICGQRGFSSLILPGVLMGMIYMGNIIIIIKEKTLSVLKEPFIINAFAMGLGKWEIIKVHLLKCVLAPVVSMSTLALSNFLGFSIVMENIFSIKGIGTIMNHAIGIKDYMVVASSVMIIGFTIILFNTLADIIYIWIDRRNAFEN